MMSNMTGFIKEINNFQRSHGSFINKNASWFKHFELSLCFYIHMYNCVGFNDLDYQSQGQLKAWSDNKWVMSVHKMYVIAK